MHVNKLPTVAVIKAAYLLVSALELLAEVPHHPVVEVLPPQVGVSRGRLDLEKTFLDGQQRHVEGASTKVENEHILQLAGALFEAVGEGRGGGLVDDAEHVEAGDGA